MIASRWLYLEGRMQLAAAHPEITPARAEGFYSAAEVEQALANHSRTNIQPRKRDRELYDTFGFKRHGVLKGD